MAVTCIVLQSHEHYHSTLQHSSFGILGRSYERSLATEKGDALPLHVLKAGLALGQGLASKRSSRSDQVAKKRVAIFSIALRGLGELAESIYQFSLVFYGPTWERDRVLLPGRRQRGRTESCLQGLRVNIYTISPGFDLQLVDVFTLVPFFLALP